MAITFPTTLDSFSTKVDNVDDVQAVDINDLQSAVEALEAKVGVNSSGVSTSLDAIVAACVRDTGNETIAGVKTFSSSPLIPTPTT